MDGIFSLHEFMLHTKNVIYLLIVAILVGMAGFWMFLSERDDDGEKNDAETGH